MRRIRLSILTIVAICMVQSAMAWGGFGHITIAYIADQHLTPEAKAKCHYYLKHSLPYYAMWMDYWRGVKKFDRINNGHAINANADGKTPKTDRVMRHLIGALEELSDGRYKSQPDSLVRQRLINMIHYVGDMHCPSHIEFPPHMYYDKQKNYPLYRNGKKASLHGFWDGSTKFKRGDLTCEQYAEMVDKVSPKVVKRWIAGDYMDWAADAIKQAHRAYKIIPEGTELTQLTEKQVVEVHELADEMALQGAYRLAHILNQLFKE